MRLSELVRQSAVEAARHPARYLEPSGDYSLDIPLALVTELDAPPLDARVYVYADRCDLRVDLPAWAVDEASADQHRADAAREEGNA